MSEYDTETGIFELTATKADYSFRRTDIPTELSTLTGMDLYEGLFRAAGVEVIARRSAFMHLRATPDQVWEILSGKPSDPTMTAHYFTAKSRKDRGYEMVGRVRKISDAMLGKFRTGVDDLGEPLKQVQSSGSASCRLCGILFERGEECLLGGVQDEKVPGVRKRRVANYFLHPKCLFPEGRSLV